MTRNGKQAGFTQQQSYGMSPNEVQKIEIL